MLQLTVTAFESFFSLLVPLLHFNFPGHSVIEDRESFVLEFPTFWVLPSVSYYFLRGDG